MRVLLISANTEQLPDPVFPLGAAYMATVAEQHGHTVATYDCCFASDARAGLAAALSDFAPDAVGISLRNLDSSAYPQTTSYVPDYRSLVETVRGATPAPIVLGGAGFTVMPGTLMRWLGADVGVVGEGELAFPWVLERLAAGAA